MLLNVAEAFSPCRCLMLLLSIRPHGPIREGGFVEVLKKGKKRRFSSGFRSDCWEIFATGESGQIFSSCGADAVKFELGPGSILHHKEF